MNSLLSDPLAFDQLIQIGKWSRKTLDGTKADLPLQPLGHVWDLVESDSGNCLGRKCPDLQWRRRQYRLGRHQFHPAEASAGLLPRLS